MVQALYATRAKISAALMMTVVTGAACVQPIRAEGLLSVAPLRIFLSDGQTSEVLTLNNRSGKEQTYKVTMQDQVMDAEGNIIRQEDFPYSAKRMLRFMPRQITLQAGERQTLRVMVTAPEGLAEGEYHTHLLFDEVWKPVTISNTDLAATKPVPGFRMKMQTAHSIGLPLIYQHGKIVSDLSLKAGKLVVLKNGRPAVQVRLERSGNGEASGLVRLVEAGKDSDDLVPPRNMHVYREADQVTITLALKDDIKASLQALQQMKLLVRLEREGREVQIVAVE